MFLSILILGTCTLGALWVLVYSLLRITESFGIGVPQVEQPKKRVGYFTAEDRQEQFKRVVIDAQETDPVIIESQKVMAEQTAEFEQQYREWESQQKK